MSSAVLASALLALASAAQCPVPSESLCYPSVKGDKLVNASTSGECCALCALEDPCQSWTFNTRETQHNCHLKPAAPTNKKRGSCVSGTMPQAPVPPPAAPPPAPEGALNVLFIMVDDLRPEFNEPYGQKRLVTPSLDAFAKTALTFERAYCQYSHCSPSRNSFLSGRSPQTTGVYNFIDHFRLPGVGKDWTSLPQFFREHGYYTAGGGKLYHPQRPPKNDGDLSFDVYFKFNGDDNGCRANETLYPEVCPSDEPDSAFFDSVLADQTVEQLRKAKDMGRPFFIGTGLRRPHRRWHTPRRFYDLYANNGTFPTDMPLAKFKTAPKGMPDLAYINNKGWPPTSHNKDTSIPDSIAVMGRWGYYASVSFTDFNVGKILTALDELDLAKSTVVVFSGDHGWQLGEHGEWCKRTNFELAVRVPLLVRSPRHVSSQGQRTTHMAESLDFYRTLAALAMPGEAVEEGVEGTDLSPVFAAPSQVGLLKDASFSQMARCPHEGLGPVSPCNSVKLVDIKFMGYSVRTEEWRYTAWLAFNGTLNRALWSTELWGEELYDHRGDTCADFDAFENENVVDAHQDVRNALLKRLRDRFDTPSTAYTLLV